MGNASIYRGINRTSIGEMDTDSMTPQVRQLLSLNRKVNELRRQLTNAELQFDRAYNTASITTRNKFLKYRR